MPKKISKFRPKTKTPDYHVIQWQRRSDKIWRNLELIYSTQKLAQAGLGRLIDHRPEYATRLRVRPWEPEPPMAKRLAA